MIIDIKHRFWSKVDKKGPRVSPSTIYNIWKSDKYPCREGFYI